MSLLIINAAMPAGAGTTQTDSMVYIIDIYFTSGIKRFASEDFYVAV